MGQAAYSAGILIFTIAVFASFFAFGLTHALVLILVVNLGFIAGASLPSLRAALKHA